MIVLPTNKVPATSTNPQYLILYGLPKSGKTSAVAQLENNLIVDLEGGSKFIDALAIQARTINDLGEIAQAIRAKNEEVGHNFYKHITIDNATRLEDICMSYACTLYRQTELGKNWKGTDVTTLARGAGYKYLRDAVKKVIDMFKDLCDEFILIGHVKDSITDKDGEEVNAKEIDLVGKLGKSYVEWLMQSDTSIGKTMRHTLVLNPEVMAQSWRLALDISRVETLSLRPEMMMDL